MSGLPYRGSAKGEHLDPRTARYKADQARQRRFRRDAKRAFHGERDDVSGLDLKHETVGLEFVLDRNGQELSVEAHHELRRRMWETRGTYLVKRADRPGKLRPQPLRQWYTVIVDADGHVVRKVARGENLTAGPAKLEPGWRKVRMEKPRDKVIVVTYEAFNLAPWHSWALIEAADRGFRTEISALIQQLGREIVPVAEQATGCEVVSVPFHPKRWASHFQISFVCINKQQRKIGEFDWSHLGRPMLGSWRLKEFGYSGQSLDEVTAERNSEAGLQEALDDRGNRAVDLQLARWLDQRTEELLKLPTYAVLMPIFDAGRAAYRTLKAEERIAIMERGEIEQRLRAVEARNAVQEQERGVLRQVCNWIAPRLPELSAALVAIAQTKRVPAWCHSLVGLELEPTNRESWAQASAAGSFLAPTPEGWALVPEVRAAIKYLASRGEDRAAATAVLELESACRCVLRAQEPVNVSSAIARAVLDAARAPTHVEIALPTKD